MPQKCHVRLELVRCRMYDSIQDAGCRQIRSPTARGLHLDPLHSRRILMVLWEVTALTILLDLQRLLPRSHAHPVIAMDLADERQVQEDARKPRIPGPFLLQQRRQLQQLAHQLWLFRSQAKCGAAQELRLPA